MANAADNFEWNADNVFDWTKSGLNAGAPEEISSRMGDAWDLNPLAWNVGMAADGVRDTLSTRRDAFLQPKMQEYRQKVGAGNSADDDYGLFHDSDFQNFVRTGQTSKGFKVDDTPAGGQQTVTQQWSGQAPQIAPKADDPRRSALFDVLMKRATQNTIPDRNDPTIRAQSDANIANVERQRRNYISDVAEQSGPYANIQGERRMASERAGQQTGTFEASLLGQELQARRADTLAALAAAGDQTSEDAQLDLRERLANLDALIKQQGFGLQQQGLNQDWQRALMQNNQFNSQLGLSAEDRASYWDAVRRGLL